MNKWAYNVNNELTLYGAYCELYDRIGRFWKADSTKHAYDLIFCNRILPEIPDHNVKPISTYTREDFDAVLTSIIEKGQGAPDAPFRAYAESTIRTFRRLIYYIFEAAAFNGLCDNVLWETDYNPNASSESEDIIAKQQLHSKSFTVPQEQAVAKALLADPMQSGQNIGLLLMYGLGLRNAEACAVNYGDIRPLPGHPESEIVLIYKTTGYDNSNIKIGGKTKNADRAIPLPSKLSALIAQRRYQLEKSLSISLEQYPIACVDNDWENRCTARHLTAAARTLFQEINIEASQLALIDQAIRQDPSFPFEDKDPTAYLFRRNFGTHLHILGLTEAEIAYIIGHDIEDQYETRNEFINDQKLYAIKIKMDQRPLVNECSINDFIQELSTCRIPITGSTKLQFPASASKVKLQLTTKEPNDMIHIRITTHPQTVHVKKESITYTDVPQEFERTVDVKKQYHKVYRIK